MTAGDEESDLQSSLSDAPPDWNSDDEPPEDRKGDENCCSRDGAVRKVIQKVGKGLERPGQNDIVTLRFSTLQLDGSSERPSFDGTVEMGEGRLPLAVEFALKNMRVGEASEVRAPAAYAAFVSPLCGRSLRTQPGVLPKTGKVKRRHRFLPAAPRELTVQAKKDLTAHQVAQAAAQATPAEAEAEGAKSASPPMFKARVELLGLETVLALTEDRSVTKRILSAGSSRRQPRKGDMVTFAYSRREDGTCRSQEKRTLTLGEDVLPFKGLYNVLMSMKEGERSLVHLRSTAAGEPGQEVEPQPVDLEVTLLRWRRRDHLPVGEAGDAGSSCLLKTEIRQGPERRSHDIEAGSMVLAAVAGREGPSLISWRVGEGAVPGYLDVAVASMRLCESAAFEAPEDVQLRRPTGPSYDGQTPLRKVPLGQLSPRLSDLLQANEDDEPLDSEGVAEPFLIPEDWMLQGETTTWSELNLVEDGRFTLALLAATEAVDLCLLEEDGQLHFLELERAHGNALAKMGRFEEAEEAYLRALDAVRRSAIYKVLFPTERGHIQGAYSREAGQGENPLQGMSEEEVAERRSQLVGLHLNLSLCASKAGHHAMARRHADTALGAEPNNAKALFRRGQASAGQTDYEDALRDLQRAAELLPQDRAIRNEIQSVQRSLRAHREVQKSMFVNVFQPPARKTQAAGHETS